jgi:hypothetical protein
VGRDYRSRRFGRMIGKGGSDTLEGGSDSRLD